MPKLGVRPLTKLSLRTRPRRRALGPRPTVEALPTISGAETTFNTLTLTPPTWSEEPLQVKYQWYRADVVMHNGGVIGYLNPTPIHGQIGLSLDLLPANVDTVILVAAIGFFKEYTVTSYSEGVGPILHTDLLAGAGSFDSADGYTLGTGFTIGSGLLTGTPQASTGTVVRNATVLSGVYRLGLDIKRLATGAVALRLAGAPQGLIVGPTLSAVGDNQYHDFTTAGNTAVNVQKSANFDGDIDNMYLYRIS